MGNTTLKIVLIGAVLGLFAFAGYTIWKPAEELGPKALEAGEPGLDPRSKQFRTDVTALATNVTIQCTEDSLSQEYIEQLRAGLPSILSAEIANQLCAQDDESGSFVLKVTANDPLTCEADVTQKGITFYGC